MNYLKENKEDGTFECKVCKLIKDSYIEILRHRHYTVKEWKKFDREIDGSEIGNQYQYFNYFMQRMESFESVTMQEILLQKYDITLTDYKSKKEKIFQVIDKFSVDNLNKGIDKFNRGVDQFSKVIGSTKIGMSQREYDSLLPKKKSKTVSFWTEPKSSKRKRKTKKEPQGPDYSALIGKRKVKMF